MAKFEVHRGKDWTAWSTRPKWRLTINLKAVFHNDQMTFPQRREEIVRRIRNSGWFDLKNSMFTEKGGLLDELLNCLEAAEDEQEFNIYWDDIYDYADVDRVWIATF